MGKAKIVANLGEGLYTVERDTGKAVVDAKILGLQSKLATVDQQIITVLNKRSQLDSQLIQARLNFELATEQYVAAVAGDPKASTTGWETAQKELLTLQAQYDESSRELERLRASKASIAKEITALQSVNLVSTFDAWCADYTDDATGDVATIEIPGEPQNVLIAPGAPVPNAADGQVLARKAMTGPQAFFNAAILPGWQKFKPTYRRGVITAVNQTTGKANVTLLSDVSTAQNLGINQDSELIDVPIVYDCGSSVFNVGDECVVQFVNQNWSNPQIIGFMNNPKPCSFVNIIYSNRLRIKRNLDADGAKLGKPIIDTEQKPIPSSTNYNTLKAFGTEGNRMYLLYKKPLNIESSSGYAASSIVTFRNNNVRWTSEIGSSVRGASLKFVGGVWYAFVATSLDIRRSALDSTGKPLGWEIIYSINFGDSRCVNFNASCTEAVSMTWRGNSLSIYGDISVEGTFSIGYTYPASLSYSSIRSRYTVLSISGINISSRTDYEKGFVPTTKISKSITKVEDKSSPMFGPRIDYSFNFSCSWSMSGDEIQAVDYDGDQLVFLMISATTGNYSTAGSDTAVSMGTINPPTDPPFPEWLSDDTQLVLNFSTPSTPYWVGLSYGGSVSYSWGSLSFSRTYTASRGGPPGNRKHVSVDNPGLVFAHYWEPSQKIFAYTTVTPQSSFTYDGQVTTSSATFCINGNPVVDLYAGSFFKTDGSTYTNIDAQYLLMASECIPLGSLGNNQTVNLLDKYHCVLMVPTIIPGPYATGLYQLVPGHPYFDNTKAKYVIINNDNISKEQIVQVLGEIDGVPMKITSLSLNFG